MFRDLWFVLTGRLSTAHVEEPRKLLREANKTIDKLEILLHKEQQFSRNQMRVALVAIGRVLAQDKAYTQSEFSLERKDESNRLGQQVIDCLMAEQAARDHTTGDL